MRSMQEARAAAVADLRRDLVLEAASEDGLSFSSIVWQVRERLDPASDDDAVALALEAISPLLILGLMCVVAPAVALREGSEDVLEWLSREVHVRDWDELSFRAGSQAEGWMARYQMLLKELDPAQSKERT